MATAAIQQPHSTPSFAHQIVDKITPSPMIKSQDVDTVLHYFKPNADGSPPNPTYVDKPETFYREPDSHDVTVRDVRGKEDQYALDANGFQFYKHVSKEKDFLDDEKIKAEYYPEIERLLKEA
jgi:hypothetical protein